MYSPHQIFLKPGLYQVRVAAHDEKSGHVGSANSWVEIPDLTSHHLTLSSLIIGAQLPATITNASGNGSSNEAHPQLSIQRQFQRNSDMRFLVFTYNAARDPSHSQPNSPFRCRCFAKINPLSPHH